MPPRAQPASSLDATPIREARAGVPDALFVDMKAEADRLYVSYVHEDLRLSLAGFAAIAVLLLIALRSPRRAVRARAARRGRAGRELASRSPAFS